MRIISGKFKGRRFNPPADKWPTRPTTDIAKEGLFNILGNLLDFEETTFLDLFGEQEVIAMNLFQEDVLL